MTDLREKLEHRAARSPRAGSELLRQRVALTLAAKEGTGSEAQHVVVAPSKARRRIQASIAAAVAAVAVLAAVGGVAWLLRSDGIPPGPEEAADPTPATTVATSVPQSVTPTVAPTSTTVPPTATTVVVTPQIESAADLIDGWTRLDSTNGIDSESIFWAIVEGGPGHVIGGTFEGVPAVWISDDAQSWQVVTLGESDGAVRDLATNGDVLVALSSRCTPLPEDDEELTCDAVLSWSIDGITWEEAFAESLVGGQGLGLSDVAAGPNGFVAVGTPDSGPVAYRSTDGRVWSEVALPGERRRPFAVTHTGSQWVAIGDSSTSAYEGDLGEGVIEEIFTRSAAIWTSPDGIAWTLLPEDLSVFGFDQAVLDHALATRRPNVAGPKVVDLTVGADGVVAVGWDVAITDGTVFTVSGAWHSPDGVTWQRTTLEPVPGRITAVSAVGDGYLAVGVVESTDPSTVGPGFWVSTDGLDWTHATPDTFIYKSGETADWIDAVTSNDTGLIAIGTGVWIWNG